MKFISKNSNLLIVLSPGLAAQPLTGTPAKPTVSVRFKDGVAEVSSQELVDLMLAHPGFNGDFISAEGISSDPFAATRQSSEPAHVLTELKYGTPQSREVKGGNTQLPPQLQELIKSMAVDMAKQMLPELLKSVVEAAQSDKQSAKQSTKGKKKSEPKAKKTVSTKDIEAVTPEVPKVPEGIDPEIISSPAIKESLS